MSIYAVRCITMRYSQHSGGEFEISEFYEYLCCCISFYGFSCGFLLYIQCGEVDISLFYEYLCVFVVFNGGVDPLKCGEFEILEFHDYL